MAAPEPILASARVPLPQFVIALLLVKSKPASVPVQDFVAQLRSLIRIDTRPKYNLFAHRHVDATAYRANYQQETQTTILALQARIAELEGKGCDYATVSSLVSEDESRAAVPSQSRRKRKVTEPRNMPSRLAKQVRVANSSSPMQSRHIDSLDSPLITGGTAPSAVTNEAQQSTDVFLYQIYLLQEIIANPASESRSIVDCLERALEAIGQVACSTDLIEPPIPAPSGNRSTRGNPHAAATPALLPPRIISKLLPLLLQAVDQLDQTNSEPHLEGSLIHKFITTFEEILLQVCKLAKSDETVVEPQQRDSEKGKKGKDKQTQFSHMASGKQSVAIIDLCELVIAMTTTLNTAKRAQAQMLEGCFSILMKMIGMGLKNRLFEDDEQPVTDHENQDAEFHQEAISRPSHVEGRYLIYILERVPKLINDSPSQGSSSALLTLEKKKIQNTMLNAVFGENALGLMKPSIEVHEPPTRLSMEPEVEPVEAKDWYQSEVWKLIGWDVLDGYLKEPLQVPETLVSP